MLLVDDENNTLSADILTKARISRDPRFDGKFFVAVKTTGIFCRPICPARLPKEQNVTYYSQAANAMADGFRPCFRCRPDSAPRSAAWMGVNATVNRAMTLLSEIPNQSIDTVASRLGISARYLNKLLIKAVGIPPKQFQSMQRALFAKRLIQQSGLSMTDVAFTAGYQSLRQLQRAIEQYCSATPSQLRKHKQVEHNNVSLFLSYRPPYNWQYVREFLLLRAIRGMEHVGDTTYERRFTYDTCEGYFVATHDAKRHGFSVELALSDLTYLYRVVENIKGLLDLNADPVLIEEAMRQAGIAEQALTQGLRLPSTWSVFESGCRAIVGQQVSVKAAIGQVTLLVHGLGRVVDNVHQIQKQHEKCQYYFPTPEAVANDNLECLRMPAARKAAIRQFASLFVDGNTPNYDAILSVKGIGPWTVNYLKMRGEREPDVYLDGDLIVRKMSQRYNVEPEQAAPWRSYLTLQLWRLSDTAD